MDFSDLGENPLVSDDPRVWQALVSASGPESLLVFIDHRLGARLRGQLDGEDILQDAYLQAWSGRLSLEWRGIRSFRACLQQIIVNRIRDAADRAGAAKRGADRTVHFSAIEKRGGKIDPPDSSTPSRAAQRRETALAMQEALGHLEDDVRPVVFGRIFEDKTIQAIAEELGIGLSAAKHRFRRGAVLYEQALFRALHRSRARE